MIEARLEKTELAPPRREQDDARRPGGFIVESALTENYFRFLSLLTGRLGNKSAAEDVLQSFCLRALSRSTELRDSKSADAWLYKVLRSTLMDYYRSEAARQRRENRYAQEQQIVLGDDHDTAGGGESVCNCFHSLLPSLRSEYAEILRRIDLQGHTHSKVATDLSITPANVSVRLHRARQAMRKALGNCCGSCCEHSYRDCDCKGAHRHTDIASSDISAYAAPQQHHSWYTIDNLIPDSTARRH